MRLLRDTQLAGLADSPQMISYAADISEPRHRQDDLTASCRRGTAYAQVQVLDVHCETSLTISQPASGRLPGDQSIA
jgi:hypothetical protein